MHGQEKRKNVRNTALFMDIVHIVIGAVIVILAVISFLNPFDHMLMFPVIFLLAAILNVTNGIHKIRECGRNKKGRASGAAAVFLGLILLVLCIVSAISIWG